MNIDTPALINRCVTVALAGTELPDSLVRVLRYLAAEPGVELRAVFVEDDDLIKAAGLPFTVEFCSLTSQRRPISGDQVEARLRREAAASEQHFANVARAVGRRWRFEVVRHSAHATPVAALGEQDLVLLPARARTAVEGAPASPVIAIIDASSSGVRALTCARTIAADEGAPIEVFRVPSTRTVSGGEPDESVQVSAVEIALPDIAAVIERTETRLTVLAGPLVEHVEQTAPGLREMVRAPLLILR